MKAKQTNITQKKGDSFNYLDKFNVSVNYGYNPLCIGYTIYLIDDKGMYKNVGHIYHRDLLFPFLRLLNKQF